MSMRDTISAALVAATTQSNSQQVWALQVFAKCGVIKEDDERRPRVKVYRDRESGMPKGDGLVTYLKDPSVGYPPHMQTNLCCVLFFLCHV